MIIKVGIFDTFYLYLYCFTLQVFLFTDQSSKSIFFLQEGDDGNMVYVNEKGKLEVSREGKVLSVMPPGD